MSRLSGKTVFITGGTSGIGKATVQQMLELGAQVYSLSMSKDRIAAAQAEMGSDHVFFAQGDVNDEAGVQQAFADCVQKFGTVDILVNNAGLGLPTTDLASADLDTYDKMFDANARGVFICTKEALKIMKPKKSGHILTVISMAGQRSNATAPLYCASKFAARGYTQGLADQVSKDNIRITDINPGPVDTNYWGDRAVPRDKFLQPKDVADVIVFSCSVPEHVVLREINFDSIAWLGK